MPPISTNNLNGQICSDSNCENFSIYTEFMIDKRLARSWVRADFENTPNSLELLKVSFRLAFALFYYKPKFQK